MSTRDMQDTELQTLTESIADALDDTDGDWHYLAPDDDGTYRHAGRIVSGDRGAMLWVHGESWAGPGRLEIAGDYPRSTYGDGFVYLAGERSGDKRADRIGVSSSKTAEQIARDIVRRCLPAYLERLALVREVIARTESRLDADAAAACRLAKVLGTSSTVDRRHGQAVVNWRPSGSGYGSFDVSGGSVSVSLSMLTPEIAERIAELLRYGSTAQ